MSGRRATAGGDDAHGGPAAQPVSGEFAARAKSHPDMAADENARLLPSTAVNSGPKATYMALLCKR